MNVLQNTVSMQSVTFGNSKPVLTITANGEVKPGDGFTPTEAGYAAIHAMHETLRGIIERAKQDEREACAKIADDRAADAEACAEVPVLCACGGIAAAIRARGNREAKKA